MITMNQDKVIITVNFIKRNISHDLEVPLDISVNELCVALFELYLPITEESSERYYLRTERPIALLKGDGTLREFGIRNGSIINIAR